MIDPFQFENPASIPGFTFTTEPVIRQGCIIYPNVSVGSNFITGHNVVIRSKVTIGDYVLLGTNTVIDGDVKIGDYVKIETGCYLPPGVTIGSRVFIGPNVTFTNDLFPLKRREDYTVSQTTVGDNVSFGAGSVVLPGINIGSAVFIAAGAVVTKDVPSESLVIGNGKIEVLPEKLKGVNHAKSWK